MKRFLFTGVLLLLPIGVLPGFAEDILLYDTWLHSYFEPNRLDDFVQAHAASAESFRILVIAQEHHRTIAQALSDRDGARAETLAREHARLSLRNLSAVIQDADRFKRLPGATLITFA